MEIFSSAFSAPKYVCQHCNITCSKKNDWDRHIITNKHLRKCGGKTEIPNSAKEFICKCHKKYLTNSGLWKHQKRCNIKPDTYNKNGPIGNLSFLTNLVMEVVKNNNELQKQNTEYQKQNQDFQKQMLEVCKNTNSHNTINSHNKTFNMQVFLNEKCKDAMNIMDFVNSMTLELSDLEDVGEMGYVEGISKIIIRKLNELDIYKRPIHCSDFKREIMYVKDMDVWSKENSTFDKIRKAIKYVTKKNGDLLIPWIQKYPMAMNIQHPHNDIYMRIMNQAMGGRESFIESENKIIRKISKAVQIDKTYMC
jgi:hypothetical protein